MTGNPKEKLCSLLAVLFVLTGLGVAQSMSTRHVRDIVTNGEISPIGRLPQDQILQLDIVLSLRDPAGLQRFLADVYNPLSPQYLRFITPEEFTARFGPTQEQYESVLSFARSNRLVVVGGSRDGMDVQVKGTVSDVESAFQIIMYSYRHPTENRMFYSADREPTVDLPFNLWHVSGLDNFSIPRPSRTSRDEYAAAHGLRPEQVTPAATTGSGPSASFLGSDMRAAYYGGTALTGAGQHLGLYQYSGVDLADLNTYYANVHQTNSVPINLISTDGTSTSCVYPACDDTEQIIDLTQALGMAPGLASLDVYIGGSDTAILSAMTTHNPLPTTIGVSWLWGPADPSTDDPYFQKMAAQGQSIFAASGDSSTWVSSGFFYPASDAWVASVGGTDLNTASAGGAWASETAWSSSSGGISPSGIAIPAWQQLSGVITSTNKGSTTLRNGPDISANANWTFYTCTKQQACQANYYGGTSFAAPMWAGFMALVNQQRAANGQTAEGFFIPTIYSQNLLSGYPTNFHDITSGISGSYSAVPGFDLVTGWGSPQPALISTLASTFALSPSSSTLTIIPGNSSSSTITNTVTGGLSFGVTLVASGQPAGVTVSVSPTQIIGNGTWTTTVSVAATASPGTYPITITGTGNGLTRTITITLVIAVKTAQTITFGAAPALSVGGTGTLNATASSGLAVTFASITTSICTVSGSTVTGVAAGVCTITANQAGNTTYNAAPQVAQNITVAAVAAGNTWSSGATMPYPVDSPATATLGSKIYVFGGRNAGLPVSYTQIYNPATNVWSTGAPMPLATMGPVAVPFGGYIYVIGGQTSTAQSSVVGTVYQYNPTTNTWATKASLPTPRASPGAVEIAGQIYVAGGNSNVAYWVANLESFDPVANAWTTRASMISGRSNLSAAAFGQKMIVTAGYSSVGGMNGSSEEYDTTTNTWTSIASSQHLDWACTGNVRGRLYVLGGGLLGGIGVTTSQIFDPTSNSWSAAAPMPTATLAVIGAVYGGKIYCFGGKSVDPGGSDFNSVQIYKP